MKVVKFSSKKEGLGSVICADSDLTSLDFYERVLGEKGYDIHPCTTGLDVIAEIESHPVDLVILDVGLTESSNVSICKMIKKRSSDNDVPIIIVADADDEDSILSFLNEGVDDYLVKPIKVTELVTKVSVTLAKRKMRPAEKSKEPKPEPEQVKEPKEASLPQIKMLQQEKEEKREIKEQEKKEKKKKTELFAGVYEILDKIGEGSYSIVYHAIDHSKAQPIDIALKVFELSSYKEVESSTQSFLLREAYEMSKLEHQNIVKMLDFGKFDKTYYMVMELVQGNSLQHMVSAMGPLGEDDLIYVAYQGASVLQYLEKKNMIHRDIKPENLLVNSEGEIKFTDFGLARHCADNALTLKNQQFMGTPQFVSPEQIAPDQKIDIRCDVYSLGATLYYCGTKTFPFTGKNVVEVLINNLNTTPTPMHEINPSISESFSKFVVKMMDKQKENRYSPTELKKELKEMLKRHN